MKILFLADEEAKVYWDFFKKEDFEGVDLIVSCGDLKAEYLSFLATMVPVPVLYVHGNHDAKYDKKPPEGCICIDDCIYEFNGVRILGLGGSHRYKPGPYQFTEREMAKRVRKLFWKLKFKKGFDILVTHSPARGLHDDEDMCHMGFEVFNKLIEQYRPKYFVHGHVHLNYGRQFVREDMVGETHVVNAYEKYMLEL
ncbi:MAG: metallophosphoesterase [Agathobacter sp.]|nr:metallophosphoesterase [Agathobacter sp.]